MALIHSLDRGWRSTSPVCVTTVGEWELCGDRFYERRELYAMAWGDVRLQYLR